MESGAISDSQITASSQYNDNRAAQLARLNFKKEGLKEGGWTTSTNDLNQWLQVDLGSYTTVTRVATQGVSANHKQWVTKYRLQYSDDGLTFHFLKEPGPTSAKVYQHFSSNFRDMGKVTHVVFGEIKNVVRGTKKRPPNIFGKSTAARKFE